MEKLNDSLYSWASILDDETREQAERTSRLTILDGHLALMPDAHLGKGASIGTVIPTRNAVIPAAVGVDIGCGMAARQLELHRDELTPEHLSRWVAGMRDAVPAGLGRRHAKASEASRAWFDVHPPPPTLEKVEQAMAQLGTLGSGNHFVELAGDERGWVWILLHSGSRGGGNKLATIHTRLAKQIARREGLALEDDELSWFEGGTDEFDHYLRDLGWSQLYALENRRLMLGATHDLLVEVLGRWVDGAVNVNCHHNYTELEEHQGRQVWITRKGAIRAGVDDYGLIPGAMGQASFVVRGLGNPDSYESCAHGAGRLMSRRRARSTLSVEDFDPVMGDTSWQREFAVQLLDEHPSAYKPIDVVMRDQADLVEVEHELHAIANYKGTS